MQKTIYFIKNNYGWLILVFYGIFLMMYKNEGSFLGDEATYSQIAKESLSSGSYFTLHWKGDLWFEKPPILIWLTALVFELFGISELSAHIVSGFFGISSAVIIYFIALELFRNKLAGFFSGFSFLTTPIILLYFRVNMMDLPVGSFISLAVLALIKIIRGKNDKWWLIFGLSSGLAVMTKSIVGLFPFIILTAAAFVYQRRGVVKNKFFFYGTGVFLVIVIPWHWFMSVKFGSFFWNDYLGFHIWERFQKPILPFPWEGNSPWSYPKLIAGRSGSWFFVVLIFFVSLSLVYLNLFFKNKSVFKRESLADWIKTQKREWIFLSGWMIIVTMPFFIASTKLPNYMVLFFYPWSLVAGGFLGSIFVRRKIKMLWLISSVSLLNFLPLFRLRLSDYGEAHPLIPKFLIRYWGLNDAMLVYLFLITVVFAAIIFIRFKKSYSIIFFVSLFIILGFNALVPFNPYRNEFIKKLGSDLSSVSGDKPIDLYFIMKPDQFSFHCVGAYYIPLGSKIRRISRQEIETLPFKGIFNNRFCFIEKDSVDEEMAKEAILRYREGVVVNCLVLL